MRKIKRGHHSHSNIIKIILVVVVVIGGILALTTYYTKIFNEVVEIILTTLLALLCIDAFLHARHKKQHRIGNYFVSGLFLLMFTSHFLRNFFGPLQCKLPLFLSVYAYDGLTILIGIYLIIYTIIRANKTKIVNYHLVFWFILGLVLAINHIVKILIGNCV